MKKISIFPVSLKFLSSKANFFAKSPFTAYTVLEQSPLLSSSYILQSVAEGSVAEGEGEGRYSGASFISSSIGWSLPINVND